MQRRMDFFSSVGCKPKILKNGNGCPYTKIDAICEISCNKGFTLKGSKQLQCSQGGKWKTGIDPYCVEYQQVLIGKKCDHSCLERIVTLIVQFFLSFYRRKNTS